MKKKPIVFSLAVVFSLVVVFSFFKDQIKILKKDCSSLYKKHSKKAFHKTLSLKQESLWVQLLETCSTEKELWFLTDALLKQSKNELLKQKEIEKKVVKQAYYKWKNYEKAIKYYTKLLQKPLEQGEMFLFQYQLASSYFKLDKNYQALVELEKSLFEGISRQERRKALYLKLQILQKDPSSSEALIKKLLIEFPEDESFLRESLAVLYESQNQFSRSIQELKQIKKQTSFIKQKIKRLEERQSNQP